MTGRFSSELAPYSSFTVKLKITEGSCGAHISPPRLFFSFSETQRVDCSDSTFRRINKSLSLFLCLVSLAVTLSGCPAKDLLYQAANLTRQLLSCLLASPVVMDFLNECLSFSRFHTFLSVLLGPTPDQIFCH